jgi:hypothetical protein
MATEPDPRSERQSALEQFATGGQRAPEQEYQRLPVAAQDTMPHGAQMVAVKRNISIVFSDLKELGAAAGSDWFYRFPVKNRRENRTDWIEGPSIKLANDLARCYRNCEVDCRMQDMGDYWVFYARFFDVENGFQLTRPFQQRKSGSKIGGGDAERALDIAFQIGASKAIRNVVVNALQTYADYAFEEARNSLVDKIGKDLDNYRERTASRVAAHIDLARVEAVVGRSKKDWLAPDVARVIAMMRAVNDGMATYDETFPPLGKTEAETTASTTATLDDFAQPDSGVGQGEAASESSSPTSPGRDEGGEPHAKTGAGDVASPPSPAEIIAALRDRIATATDAEALQEAWDQMDIEGKFQADKTALQRARKVLADRKLELGL